MLQVNNNGLISFNSSLPSPNHIPTPLPLAGRPFVAPFWADIDTRGIGAVWIRETNNSAVLNRAREDIQTTFKTPISFQPQFAFIATWDRVGYFSAQTDLVRTIRSIRLRPLDLSGASHSEQLATRPDYVIVVLGARTSHSTTFNS